MCIMGRTSILQAIDFAFCDKGDKVLLCKPRVLLTLLEFFYMPKPV